jgi:predicted transcriptional regulator
MKEISIITPQQCRAARGWLEWSQADLEAHSGVSIPAIKQFEKGYVRTPHDKTMRMLFMAFSKAGVIFTEDNGIKSIDRTLTVMEGDDVYLRVLDDVFESCSSGEEVLFMMVDNALSSEGVIERDKRNREKGITYRHLVSEDASTFLYPDTEYRLIPKERFINNVIVVYADKVATFIDQWKCLLVTNADNAAAQRNLFELVWGKYHKP